jgi:hypothetical protein
MDRFRLIILAVFTALLSITIALFPRVGLADNQADNPNPNLIDPSSIQRLSKLAKPHPVQHSMKLQLTENGTKSAPAIDPIGPHLAQTVILDQNGALQEGDEVMESDDSRFDTYMIEGRANQNIAISVVSDDFDTYLMFVDENGNEIAQNDDIDGNTTNSQITATLPRDGHYLIVVNGYDSNSRGNYRVVAVIGGRGSATNSIPPEAPVVTSFSCNGASSCNVSEGDTDYLSFSFEDRNGNASRWSINDFSSEISPPNGGATVRPGISCACPDGVGQCDAPATNTYNVTVSDTTGRTSNSRSVTVTCSP